MSMNYSIWIGIHLNTRYSSGIFLILRSLSVGFTNLRSFYCKVRSFLVKFSYTTLGFHYILLLLRSIL